jgi:hypothetical protein
MLLLILDHDNLHTYSNWFIIHKSSERCTLYRLSCGEHQWTAISCLVSVQLFLWLTGHPTDRFLEKLADICSYFTVIVAAVTIHPLLHCSEIWRLPTSNLAAWEVLFSRQCYPYSATFEVLTTLSCPVWSLSSFSVLSPSGYSRGRARSTAVRLPTDGLWIAAHCGTSNFV